MGAVPLPETSAETLPEKLPEMTRSAARSPRERAAETRRQRSRGSILSAAEELFAQRGYRSTTVGNIASRARVSVGTLYNNFDGKPALAGMLWQPLYLQLASQVDDQLASGTDATAVLEHYLHQLMTVAVDHRSLTVSLIEALQEETMHSAESAGYDLRPEHGPKRLVMVPAVLRKIIERGQETGEFLPCPPAGDLAVFLTNAVFTQVVSQRAASAERLAGLAVVIVLRALGAPNSPRRVTH